MKKKKVGIREILDVMTVKIINLLDTVIGDGVKMLNLKSKLTL